MARSRSYGEKACGYLRRGQDIRRLIGLEVNSPYAPKLFVYLQCSLADGGCIFNQGSHERVESMPAAVTVFVHAANMPTWDLREEVAHGGRHF